MSLLSGLLRFLSPSSPRRRRPSSTRRRRNPQTAEESAELRAAWEMAQERYGDGGQVVELDESERRPAPRYGVVVGKLDMVSYSAPRGSNAAGVIWDHESGDRGFGRAKARQKMILAADPETGRPFLIRNKSPMKLTKEGLVG